MESGRTYFVPSRAKRSNVTSASDASVASTHLKRDTGNTEDGLRDWVQLKGVSVLLVSIWENSLLRTQPRI